MVDTTKSVTARVPPALNPEQLALTQPWKDFVSLGLIQAITAKFTPGGTHVTVDISSAIPCEQAREGLAPGVAKQLIVASGLAPQKGAKGGNKKNEEPLPARSLCAKDVERVADFPKRLRDVAGKIGPSTALGRIGSLKMNSDGAASFEEWWSSSSPEDKSRLVMDKKHYDGLDDGLKNKLHEIITASNSPFRGPFPQNSHDDEEEKEVPQEPKKTVPAAPPKGGKAGEPASKAPAIPPKGGKAGVKKP